MVFRSVLVICAVALGLLYLHRAIPSHPPVTSMHIDIYDLRTLVDKDFDCVRLVMKPNPALCLYPDVDDIYISKLIRSTGLWEPKILTRAFQNILHNDTKLGVVDVGANIGVYSLVAAAMGHNVIAVEPFDRNLRRLHKAINLGNFNERIVVVRHAVSDRRELVSLDRRNTRNQGAIRVNADTAFNQSDRVRSIFLDDLTDLALRHFPSRRAIIKVDIEGYERFAFRRCDRLLDAVYVPFIFMEWQIMGPFFKGGRESANRKLVQELIDHLLLRGYGTYCARSLARLDSIGWNRWPGEILWKHKLAKF